MDMLPQDKDGQAGWTVDTDARRIMRKVCRLAIRMTIGGVGIGNGKGIREWNMYMEKTVAAAS